MQVSQDVDVFMCFLSNLHLALIFMSTKFVCYFQYHMTSMVASMVHVTQSDTYAIFRIKVVKRHHFQLAVFKGVL